MNRGLSYLWSTRCSQAIEDAEIALSMPLYEEEGYHSESEANSVLTACYTDEGDYKLAYAQAEAALNVAITNGYAIDEFALLVETRDLVNSLAGSQN